VTAEHIAALVPHAGAMCLLERVVEWTQERIVLATTTHRLPDNPLRSGGRLRAVHLCEYGAQAMAVHGALVARQGGERARPGLLVSIRDARFGCQYVESLPGELIVAAERLHGTPASWQYGFRISHEGTELAAGRAAVILTIGAD